VAKKKKSKPDVPESGEASFEDRLARLQEIVSLLEDGQIGLEESLQRYEEGVKLLRECYATLERAEQKIEILSGFDPEGRPRTEPLDDSAAAMTAATDRPTRRPSQARKSGKSARGHRENEPPAGCEDAPDVDSEDRLF